MSPRVTVLGSGSAGNATLVEVDGFGLLVDCGFNQRDLAARLRAVGRTWNGVHAAVLTHTHGDHWNKFALMHLRQQGIPLYLHPAHRFALAGVEAANDLAAAGLLRDYRPGTPFDLGPLRALAQQVCHDSDPTMAFRFEGDGWAYGHASDLGCVCEYLIDLFHEVDAVGLEFNHDVPMQRLSRRPAFLVERVLSDDGHLSNEQAAAALRAVIEHQPGRVLKAVVQLHLSRECNTAELARRAAQAVLDEASPETRLITSIQQTPAETIFLGEQVAKAKSTPF